MTIYPTARPSLTLDFQKSKQLDPRVTFSRSSSATYIESGVVKYAQQHKARFEEEGLLIEESRTNLIVQSQALDTAPWVPLNGTIASSTEPSPDGTANAWRFTASASQAFNRYIITNAGSNYTFSAFVKAGNVNWVRLYAFGGYVDFDLQNLVAGFVRPEITGYGIDPVANGWVRCWVSTASTSVTQIRIYPLVNSNDATTSPGDYIDLYGAQLEDSSIGKFPTSYIPTAGSASTRASDLCEISGQNFSSWYNISSGTYLAIGDQNALDADGYQYEPGESMYSDRYLNLTTQRWRATNWRILQGTNGFLGAWVVPPVGAGQQAKTATAWTTDEVSAATLGVSSPNNPAAWPAAFPKTTALEIGQSNRGSNQDIWNGHIAQIYYYPERLTDTQLETLTL